MERCEDASNRPIRFLHQIEGAFISKWTAAGILIFAILVRLWRLGSHSLWLDELVTYWLVSGDSIGELFCRCYYYQYGSPLYCLLVSLSLKVFGASEIAMRLTSICFSKMAYAGY